MSEETPLLYRKAKRLGDKRAPMNGPIIFWFIMSSLLGIFAIISFFGSISSSGEYGSYASSTTSTTLMCTMIWFIYTLITIIAVGNRIGRLFTAISHIVFGIIAIVFSVICLVGLNSVSSIAYRYSVSKELMDYVYFIYTFAACIYLVSFCFYTIYGLYFISGEGAKKWFGDEQQEIHKTNDKEIVEYRVPSKSKRSTSVIIRCSNCDAEVSKSMKFCPGCGTELDWGD